MTLHLAQFDELDLGHLALGNTPPKLIERALPDSLPPKFVAIRSLDQLKSGKSPLWCFGFYIFEDWDESVIGSCGFKDAPIQEQVEIGYGISPEVRRLGYATRAVTELLAIAAATIQVKTVLAQVSELNIASTRVVQKLGFRALGAKLDHEGEMLVQWVYIIAA